VREIDVVLCWNMHQPQYRNAGGEYRLPWVYLHATKDYADMAWHLERVPAAKAVVNFTPVLLEQLHDYTLQFQRGVFRDPILRALQRGDADSPDMRPALAYAVCRSNYDRMVRRFPEYERLYGLAQAAAAGGPALSDQDRADSLVWYHLAWLGEGSRRDDARVQRLSAKARGFSAADRAEMLAVVGELIASIVPRYRKLAEDGRVELITSPYSHPMVPLLIDFDAALEAEPGVTQPRSRGYPGGRNRADAHIKASLAAHVDDFGSRPIGCWPPEGGVSTLALAALAANGFRWAASDESVLRNSLRSSGADVGSRRDYVYMPYAVHTDGGTIACFFRDHDLSDRIGFRYSDWHADDAVANLLSALEEIAGNGSARIVSVVLDGENAWEHYPENAYYFLSGLYQRLSADPRIRLTTFETHLLSAASIPALRALVAGSWVQGNFSTWIGSPDKNRGWDMLVAAKQAYDRVIESGRLTSEAARRAEMILRWCEGSDWFWWFGSYNPAQAVSDFEHLFRDHLRDLYAALGVQVPAALDITLSIGAGAPEHGGTMRRSDT